MEKENIDESQAAKPKYRLDARYLIAVPVILLLCFGLGAQYMAYLSGLQPDAVQAANIRAVDAFSAEHDDEEVIVLLSGEIVRKGYYAIGSKTTLRDLLEFAGLKATSDVTGVDFSHQPQHGDAYHIKSSDDPLDVTPWLVNDLQPANSAITETDGNLINLNTATSEELQQLPGIGEVKAQAIIDYRIKHNGFRYKEDLLGVEGIGSKTYEKLIDQVTV